MAYEISNKSVVRNGVMLGTTSVLALAATMEPAHADGVYLGFSAGPISGSSPNEAASSYDYSLNGNVLGAFVGVKHTLDNGLILGGEIAWNGPANGNDEDSASADYAYQLNYVVDGKLRAGAKLGSNIEAYGFVGVSTGDANSYSYASQYGGYSFFGYNYGAGVEMDIAGGVTLGLEYLARNITSGYADAGNSTHSVIAARVGFDF